MESSDVMTIGMPSSSSSEENSSLLLPPPHDPSLHPNDNLHPISKLQSVLSSLHPSPPTLSTPPCLPRVMRGPTRWRSGYIHVDDLSPLSPSRGTFSANIYLSNPPPSSGFPRPGAPKLPGSLDIWPLRYTRAQFYLNAPFLSSLTSLSPSSQSVLRKKLGDPITIEPEEGDLVILCVQRPHAVTGFKEGYRVSIQSFLEHEPNGNLTLQA
ncbi:hypothetical protein TrCOL_g6229 [Triparma columacea]|uniref:Uncharacterized protein n=1 Tax=Triparma columacea TaxID=722753 RepID=A0A9W7G2U2_9STRA|nr:hypothetical protein TrCOL_g6229 [Triparma columacea]